MTTRERLHVAAIQGEFCSRRCPHYCELPNDLDFDLCTLHGAYIAEFADGHPVRTDACLDDPEVIEVDARQFEAARG